ncbi:hypothetical protein J6590_070106 [Homalodisca vitripennis]|nr:hypothetical protein J6590_070106 [Homalodisca vitripennis]
MVFYELITVNLLCILQSNNVVYGDTYTFEPPNLKTVLFKETDLMTRCWSLYEVNLLLNRRVMQDLVPRKIPKDLPMLLRYLKNVEEIILEIPAGINQTLVMSAMADVIGAYLQAIVIPIANEAYYAGNVDYSTVYELHGLLDKWKWYLSTNGGTWSQDCDMSKIPTKVAILDLVLSEPEEACQELYVSGPSLSNETETSIGSETIVAESSRIAIPYMDNNLAPNAIALPFRKRNLYSLMDPKAAYILVKYYTLSMRCLSSNPNDVVAFSNFFYSWLVGKVIPRLHDQDRWYPAFGAVMRVVETIKQKGLSSNSQSVVVQPANEEHQDSALNANLDIGGSGTDHSGKMGNYFHIINNPFALLIIFAIMMFIFILCCCLCLCCCLKFRRKRKKTTEFFGADVDENVLKNAMISLYCGLKDSLTRSGSKVSSESSGSNVRDKEPLKQEQDRPELASYPHNTPYTNAADTSDMSLTLTSDSEDEYSSTSKETDRLK